MMQPEPMDGRGLFALLTEMQELMGILPARAAAATQSAAPGAENRADQVASRDDDAVEAGFDNMPV
jgi:hypothetical protein